MISTPLLKGFLPSSNFLLRHSPLPSFLDCLALCACLFILRVCHNKLDIMHLFSVVAHQLYGR